MQPWMAELTLSVAEDAQGGADALERRRGRDRRRRRRRTWRGAASRPPRQQIGFLAGAPVKDQVASLNWTVGEIVGDPDSYQRVVDEWMAGDLRGLKRDALDPLQQGLAGALPAADRRAQPALGRACWPARLKSPGKVVVVVGIGHLIGPDGLPALLRARGFDVEGPSERVRPPAAIGQAPEKVPDRRIDPPERFGVYRRSFFQGAPVRRPFEAAQGTMANNPGAKKAIRKIARRTEVNRARRSRVRTFVRKFEEALAAGDLGAAKTAFVDAQSELMRAVGKGVVHKNTGSRKVSRLAAQLKKAQAA